MSPPNAKIEPERLAERLAALPGIERLREAATGIAAYLVGGAVRDLLLGRDRADIDVAVEGEVAELARRLGGEVRAHERFDTAAVRVDGLEVDLAATRSETYAHPGALPEVRPASLAADLSRRDFTVNAMAVPLAGDPELIDPHRRPRGPATGRAASAAPALVRGRPDARPASRAVRGALRVRAGARHRGADPARRPLHRLARPGGGRASKARRGAGGAPGRSSCSANGGCSSFEPGALELAAAVGELTAAEPWLQVAPRADAVLAAALGRGVAEARQLASAEPGAPLRGRRARPGAKRGRAGARQGAGRRVARPIRRRVAGGPARDRRPRPDRGGSRGGSRRSDAACARLCARSSTGRSMAERRSFERRLPRRAKMPPRRRFGATPGSPPSPR